MIRYATIEDIDEILQIWKEILKKDGRCLAIPFKSPLLDSIKKKTFFVYEIEGKIVAFGGFKFLKRKNIVKIINLCVKEEFRGSGISTKMLRTIYSKIKNFNTKKIVECQDGAKNNSFWIKYGMVVGIKECKTMKVKIILLDDFILRRI